VRLVFAKSKFSFLKNNIFDLLSIIPFNSLFSFFRFARIFRLVKFARLLKFSKLLRLVGVVGKVKPKLDKFLKTNGFNYMIYISLGLILLASFAIMIIEKQSFFDALWWSIVTCTTVGYGDISPSTAMGRIIAVILMLFGIGFIGMLTGTITTYFSNKVKKTTSDFKDTNDLFEITKDMSAEQLVSLTNIATAIKSGLLK